MVGMDCKIQTGITACTVRLNEIIGDPEVSAIVINKLWNEVSLLRHPYVHK
jgi:hypothetical protein